MATLSEKVKIKKIILAKPRGFCAGVNRAIDIVNIALERYGTPLYVRHEIVHNHHVVNDFKNRGAIFVEDLNEVPDNSCVIFSAHGTDPKVLEEAQARGLKILDAVCPLVTKVHLEIEKAVRENKVIIYIGHKGHQEVIGSMGHARDNIYLVESVSDVYRLSEEFKQQGIDSEIVVCTQTTLSVDDTAEIVSKLKETFEKIEFPKAEDICYATQNRQDAVKELIKHCDHILIIGSNNSSNTLRLVELAKKSGKAAELVPDPDNYEVSSELNDKVIGISSGASAPESLVETLVSKLSSNQVETLNYKEEKIVFPMLKELN